MTAVDSCRLRYVTSIVTFAPMAAFAALIVWRASTPPKKPNVPPPAPAVTPAPPLEPEPPLEVTRVPNSGFPCEVDDALANKCRRCHTTPSRHGAPFRLLTWDDTQVDRSGEPLYRSMARVIVSGYMPFRTAANPPVEQLTDVEKRTILDWIAAGAPRGDCGADAGAAAKRATSGGSTRAAAPKRHSRPAPSASSH